MRARYIAILLTTALSACGSNPGDDASSAESAATPAGSAQTCSINNIAWTVVQTPGTTGTSLPANQAICSSGFSFQQAGSTTIHQQLPNFTDDPAGATMASSGLAVGPTDTTSAHCYTTEYLPLLQPESANPAQLKWPLVTASDTGGANAPRDLGLAQTKFAALQNHILLAENGRPAPFITLPPGYATVGAYDAALHTYLVAETELLFELEAEHLTAAQQEQVWNLYVENEARPSCSGKGWVPPASTPPACMTSLPNPPPGLANWGTYMRRALNACSALGTSYASVGAATTFAPRCFALASYLTNADSTTCTYQPYRDQWRVMANALIQRAIQGTAAIPALQPAFAATTGVADANIQAELGLIQQWYAASKSLYPAGADRNRLWNDASTVIGAFWAAASTPAVTAITAAALAGAGDGSLAQTFTTNSLSMDVQVLLAAANTTNATTAPHWAGLTGAPPLTGAPLLFLLTDIFQALAGRLEYAGAFEDFACRFSGGCSHSVTPLAETWQALGALADATALSGALTTSVNTTGMSPTALTTIANWNAGFSAIQRNHAATVEAAVLDASQTTTYTSTLMSSGTATLPAPVRGLSRIVQTAAAHWASYTKTGLLGVPAAVSTTGIVQPSYAANTLNIGLQDSFLGTTVGSSTQSLLVRFKDLDGTLGGNISSFITQEYNAVQSALGSNANAGATQDLASEITATQTQLNFLESQITGLQASDANAGLAFGTFMNAYNTAAKSSTLDPNAMSPVTSVLASATPTSVPAGAGSGWTDIGQIAFNPVNAHGWPAHGVALPAGNAAAPVPQGWILNIAASGTWTPTCALRTAQVSIPPTTPGGAWTTLPVTGWDSVQAGPAGYYIAVSNGVASLSQISSQTGTTSTTTSTDPQSQTCTSSGQSTGSGGQQSSTSNSTCTSTTSGQSLQQSTGSTTGTGQTTTIGTSASYSMGIRDPRVPFPNAPVGSLLVVQMTAGKRTPANVIDVQVLEGGTTTLVLNQPTDVYVVVNDISGCTFNALAGSINVSVTELQPASGAPVAAMIGIKNAAAYIASATPALIRQGTLLPDDLSSLSTTVASIIAQPLQQYQSIPPNLTSLTQAWLSAAMVHIERLIEIIGMNQQASLLQIKLAQYQQDLAVGATSGRYYALARSQAIENMNAYAAGMQDSVTKLLQLMTEEFYPASRVKYPQAITDIKNGANFTPLTTALDWTRIDTTNPTAAKILAESVESTFAHYAGVGSTQGTFVQVALDFPNPNYVPTGAPYSSGLPVADLETSQAMWKALTTGSKFSFTLTPEQLYGLTGSGRMACARVAPIIDSIALYLGVAFGDASYAPNITDAQYHFPIAFHDEQRFAIATGLDLWHFGAPAFGDPSWLTNTPIYLVAGNPSATPPMTPLRAVATAIQSNPNVSYTAGAGLSPFSTIDLNFGGTGVGSFPDVIATNLTSAPTNVAIVIQLETQPLIGATNLNWVKACSP